MKKKVAIIGGGAAGVFCAIQLSKSNDLDIHVFEKSTELLKKVKISGGGRCNVTHNYISQSQFAKNYPRGQKILKQNLNQFSPKDMRDWLETKGVKLKTEEDGRVFPISDDSQTIVDCFEKELKRANIPIHFNSEVDSIQKDNSRFILEYKQKKEEFDFVVVATGGANKARELEFIQSLNSEIIPIVPSLFTFKIKDKALTELMGISIQDVSVNIIGSSFKETGPLLITHWGLSGPAILKLSAWAAFLLNEKSYNFQISINWMGGLSENKVLEEINTLIDKHPNGKVQNYKFEKFSQRIWNYLITKADIDEHKKWTDLSKKNINKLSQVLTNTVFDIKGKTTYKEEFVTAGGIDTQSIHTKTMESKTILNLYFIGEVTNIDGITGGFNFQNAWTGAYICAKDIISKIITQ